MQSIILREQLREAIGGHKVQAAVFYTFNFEADFFENYLLPVFLPDAPFTDNRIQNAIVWRKFATELPPVTVYCDFHAKGNQAPNLGYEVRTIDLPSNENGKHCFHPKLALIRTEGERLVVVVGSQNLTTAGWCQNLESCSVLVFENDVFFPRAFKDQFRRFVEDVLKLTGVHEPSSAEEAIRIFFGKIKYTHKEEDVPYAFFQSLKSSFFDFIGEIRTTYNRDLPFEAAEVMSPYHSGGKEYLEKLQESLGLSVIRMSIPLENNAVIGMAEEQFHHYARNGVEWCTIPELQKEKGFRFPHLKVYHLLGETEVFTIVGSPNATQAASQKDYNVETAILMRHPRNTWKTLLEPLKSTAGYFFGGHKEEEGIPRDRKDVPSLEFELDWAERTLAYRWLNAKERREGYVEWKGVRLYEISTQISGVLELREEQLWSILADNPLIPFRYKYQDFFFEFYPVQKNLSARPLPARLKISDTELLALWAAVDVAKSDVETQSRLIEQWLDRITDDADGSLRPNLDQQLPSSLNRMAAHLNALIKLQEKLLKEGKTAAERNAIQSAVDYYLYSENIDTLPGYLRILKESVEQETLTEGFCWLLIQIIIEDFYRHDKLKRKNNDPTFQKFVQTFLEYQKTMQNSLKKKGLEANKLNWLNQMIKQV